MTFVLADGRSVVISSLLLLWEDIELSVLDKNIAVYKNRKLSLFLSQFAYEPSSKKKILKHAIKKVNIPPKGLHVLDIGFGNGLNIFSFDRENEVFGVEIVQNMVDFANKTAKKHGYRNYGFKLYDGMGRIPFDNESFDVVICSHVLEHVPDDEFILQEIHRVLRKRGMSFILIPINDDSEKDIHAREYTVDYFGRLLKKYNFEAVYQTEADKLSVRLKSKLKFTSKSPFSICRWVMFNALLSKLPYGVQAIIERKLFQQSHFTQYVVAARK